MVFYNSLKNCAKNSNHNKLEITSRGSPSVMLRLSLLMDSAFVYINCWAHFDGSIEKWRKNLNCYRKPSSISFARFLSSLGADEDSHCLFVQSFSSIIGYNMCDDVAGSNQIKYRFCNHFVTSRAAKFALTQNFVDYSSTLQ